MIKKLLNFFKKEYKTLNRIEISKNSLLENYHYLSILSRKIQVAPVLKSNGYGHGIVNMAKIFDSQNSPFFCVDSLHEAYQLSKSEIKTPILITGYTNPQNLKIKKLPFSYALYTLDLAKTINKYQPQAGVHIFVDTGMRREGVTLEELPRFLEQLKSLTNLKVEGLMSHLASANGKDDKIFQIQIENFKTALKICQQYSIKLKWVHLTASGGLINQQTRKIISQLSNLSRVGLALYGLEDNKNLKGALQLISCIIQIKTLKKGETTGYNGTFTAKKDMRVGILPLGYNDGVDRRLSNRGFVKIDGKFCRILGLVSMNITTIDLSNIQNPKTGQEVIIYSQDKKDLNSIESTAKICKTIPYDILISLSASTKRIIKT